MLSAEDPSNTHFSLSDPPESKKEAPSEIVEADSIEEKTSETSSKLNISSEYYDEMVNKGV